MTPPSLNPGPYQILLVEDNPGDVLLVREALEESSIPKRIHVAEDGMAAIELLRGRAQAGALWPDIVLLDLNLPKKNGHEVLAAIREDPRLAQMPVIIFTSSAAPQDVRRAYRLQASCYVNKPAGFGELMSTIRLIEKFWLGAVRLPSRAG